MDCNKIQEMISLYIDLKLPKNKRLLFEEHLKSCSDCKEEVEAYIIMINNLNDLDIDIDLPVDFHTNLMRKVNKEIIKSKKTNYRTWYTSIAAVFVIVLVFGVIGISNLDKYNHEIKIDSEFMATENTPYDMIEEGFDDNAEEEVTEYSKLSNEKNEPMDKEAIVQGEKTARSEVPVTDKCKLNAETLKETEASGVINEQASTLKVEPTEKDSIHKNEEKTKEQNLHIMFIGIVCIIIIIGILYYQKSKNKSEGT